MSDLNSLSAGEMLELLGDGKASVADVVRAHLARIDAREVDVQAWAHLDRGRVLRRAAHLDRLRRSGKRTGPLHGVPIGLKDIIDTADFPTENGTVLDRGRRPGTDAVLVKRLRAAGAVIIGKTVTTELATLHPAETRNPRNLAHTPGGSSSGSAAAVADFMVPLAVGSQTGGSVIRPAAYCGIIGFKPTRGRIPLDGVLTQSPTFDQMGVLTRTVEDAALITDVMSSPGRMAPSLDPASLTTHVSLPTHRTRARRSPSFAFVRSPIWDNAEPEMQAALSELAARPGMVIDEVILPGCFDRIYALHRTIVLAELATNLDSYAARGVRHLSEMTRAMIEEGRRYRPAEIRLASKELWSLCADIDPVFARHDVILTPATGGPAPHGLASTGSPEFCILWTALGLPAVSVPIKESAAGLPLGIQIVGPINGDARALAAAQWLVRELQG